MDYITTSLFFLLIGTAVSEWTTEDGRTKAIECYHQVLAYKSITNLLIDVTTPQAINDFCRLHDNLQKCIRDNEHYMSLQEATEYQSNISGVNNFYVQVCPPGSDITKEYEENAACFKLIANKILYCGSDLPDINSYRMKNDLLYRCCALEQHRVCVKLAASERCGNAAADVIEKILLRYFNRQIKRCNTPTHGCDYSGSTTVQDWTTTTLKRDNSHSTNWIYQTTQDDRHRKTEPEWKRATVDESNKWGHSTEETVSKKHKHNSAISATLNSVISVLSCLAAILLHKL